MQIETNQAHTKGIWFKKLDCITKWNNVENSERVQKESKSQVLF